MARLTARRRHLVMATVSVLALAATIPGCVAMATEDTGAPGRIQGTGKSDGKPGGTPGTASPGAGRTTAPARVSAEISHGSESKGKVVNITIDDGPEPVWTEKVLGLLKRYDVKATFCIVGTRAKEYPALVKKVVAAGHRLCNHSVDHNTAMDQRSEEYQKEQVLDALKMIRDAAGKDVEVRYYRAPGGAFTPYSREVAASHGMRPLGWSVDTHDWQNPGSARIVETVKRDLREGPTVLFHDGGGNRSQTVTALEELLPWLKDQGYAFAFPEI
ncbi:polysaccharide deacetylase family protein [Streptomyces sp. NPDC046215]|uniref:Polysaccharide deacetylase family protein n=1 Tax=Streptomyces stramineus TaxID=173861 RepID=A0ABP3JTK2_9ACTN